MSEYGADYLRRLREAVDKFEEAFDAWMATQVESTHLGPCPRSMDTLDPT